MAERELIVRVLGDSSSLERSFTRSAKATSNFDRNLSRSARGAIAASVSFRGLGRAIAFGSSAFLGGAGLVFAVRSSVEAADQSQKAHRALEAAVTKLGDSARQQLPAVDKWAAEQARFGVSATTAVTGLARLVVLTGSVGKAMGGYTAALEISRATGRSFNQILLATGKALSGQTTALARYIGKIPTGTTATELLARVQKKFGGQAQANSDALDKLSAELSNLKLIAGGVLLPTVERLAASLADWLSKTENQVRVQNDLKAAFADITTVFNGFKSAVEVVDKITGSFKNTLELLLALKVASVVTGWAASLGLLAAAETTVAESAVVSRISQYTSGIAATGTAASVSAGKVSALSLALKRLGAITVVTVAVEVVIHRKSVDDFFKGLTDKFTRLQQGGFTNALAKAEAKVINLAPGVHVDWQSLTKAIDDQTKQNPPVLSPTFSVNPKLMSVGKIDTNDLKLKLRDAIGGAVNDAVASVSSKGISASLKNTFFDNAIARILLRGGLGDIGQQISALEEADRRIANRIAVTKDITRKQNLEDQLLQNQAKIRDLRDQQIADATQKRQDVVNEFIASLQLGVTKAQATARFTDDIDALKALEAGLRAQIREFGRTADLQGQLFDAQQQLAQVVQAQKDARQFSILGLGPTGEDRVPLVKTLQRQLANVSAAVQGTFLDTDKTRSVLKNIKTVLSAGVGEVSTAVRSKIKEMLDGINQQLGDHAKKLTKFRHTNANALLAGLGLDPETTRILRQRLAQVGAGGTVPGTRSQAFSAAGAGTTVIPLTVNLDGKKIATNTTQHQRRSTQRRSESRRGPYAGRN